MSIFDDVFDFLGTDKARNIFTVFTAVTATGLGLWFARRTRKLDEQKKRLEAEEAQARAGLALNIETTTQVYESGNHVFLETTITVHNPSRTSWAVPAGYVSYRALIDTANPTAFTGRETFHDLPECDGLTSVRNRAYLADGIWFVGPDERVTFTRVDRLPKSFQARYPVLSIQVLIYGGSFELLSRQKTQRNGFGKVRLDWMGYMREREAEPIQYPVFGTLDPTAETTWVGFRPGDRCLLARSDGGGLVPDEARSRQFQEVLESVTQWTLDKTVKIG